MAAEAQSTETLGGVRLARTIAEVRAFVADARAAGERVGLVPTMGALHEGHLSLIDVARCHAERVVVTIFVNPMQFAPSEDFDTYPRPLRDDCAAAAARGAALVFAPSAAQMYTDGFQTHVEVEEVTRDLCGASRPHFFRGVTTVVLKLLNIAMADVAVFGEKDFQQLQTLRRMVRDLDHPTRILGAPTVREADGLAMSSRNARLPAEARTAAAAIPAATEMARSRVAAGETEAEALCADVAAVLKAAGGQVDYVRIACAEELVKLIRVDRPARLFVAVSFGAVRLIDNVALPVSQAGP